MGLIERATNVRRCGFCGNLITFVKTKTGKFKPVGVKLDPDLGYVYKTSKLRGFFTHRCLRDKKMEFLIDSERDKETLRDKIADTYSTLLMECFGDSVKFREVKRKYNQEIESLRRQNS